MSILGAVIGVITVTFGVLALPLSIWVLIDSITIEWERGFRVIAEEGALAGLVLVMLAFVSFVCMVLIGVMERSRQEEKRREWR